MRAWPVIFAEGRHPSRRPCEKNKASQLSLCGSVGEPLSHLLGMLCKAWASPFPRVTLVGSLRCVEGGHVPHSSASRPGGF